MTLTRGHEICRAVGVVLESFDRRSEAERPHEHRQRREPVGAYVDDRAVRCVDEDVTSSIEARPDARRELQERFRRQVRAQHSLRTSARCRSAENVIFGVEVTVAASRRAVAKLLHPCEARSIRSAAPPARRADREQARRAEGSRRLPEAEQTPVLPAVLPVIAPVLPTIRAVVATGQASFMTPAADQAGTISSFSEQSRVTLLLRPPRGPPRWRR